MPKSTRPPRTGTCQDCGQDFIAARTGAIAPRCRPCARDVQLSQQRKWMRDNYVPVEQERKCIDCGSTYSAPGRDTKSLRCTPCRAIARREKARAWEKRNPDKVALTDTKRLRLKAAKHRRRVRERSASSDIFTAPEVFERDHWACQICGKAIDPNEKFPSRDSASLDHIIPLALGGTHTLNNVQLACMGCNWAKGARMSA